MQQYNEGAIIVYQHNKPSILHVCVEQENGVGGIDMTPIALNDIQRQQMIRDNERIGFQVTTETQEGVTITTLFPPHWNRTEWLAYFAAAAAAIMGITGGYDGN